MLLSYPETPGIASIKSGDGSTLFTAQRKEKVLESSENDTNVLPPFNAYSSSGNVTVSMKVARNGIGVERKSNCMAFTLISHRLKTTGSPDVLFVESIYKQISQNVYVLFQKTHFFS